MRVCIDIPHHAELFCRVLEGIIEAGRLEIESGAVEPGPPGDLPLVEDDDVGHPGAQENWQFPSVTARRGGDCKDVAVWRAASLRASGEDPDATVEIWQTGPRDLHCVVLRGDGSTEDVWSAIREGTWGDGYGYSLGATRGTVDHRGGSAVTVPAGSRAGASLQAPAPDRRGLTAIANSQRQGSTLAWQGTAGSALTPTSRTATSETQITAGATPPAGQAGTGGNVWVPSDGTIPGHWAQPSAAPLAYPPGYPPGYQMPPGYYGGGAAYGGIPTAPAGGGYGYGYGGDPYAQMQQYPDEDEDEDEDDDEDEEAGELELEVAELRGELRGQRRAQRALSSSSSSQTDSQDDNQQADDGGGGG